MKLTQSAISVLKTFAQINSNILIQPGNKIRTTSVAKNLVGQAELADVEFPVEFGIYNLQEFLGALSLFKEPDLDFNEKFVRIREANGNGASLKYVGASKDILVFKDADIKEPKYDVEFDLSQETFTQIVKGASVIGAPDLQVKTTEDGIVLRVLDMKNPSSNDFEVKVTDQPQVSDNTFNIKVDNLKLFPGSYKVGISSRGLAKFTEVASNVTVFVALEQK